MPNTDLGLTHTLPDPPVCGAGLRVRLASYPRPPATVIEVGGEIDACNAEHVSDYVMGFVHVDHPLVLDFSRVEILGTAGLGVILRFAAKCSRAEWDWALVASGAVKRLLPFTQGHTVPIAGSMDEALQRFASLGVRSFVSRDSKNC